MTIPTILLRLKLAMQPARAGIRCILLSLTLGVLSLNLNGCGQQSSHTLRVGTTPGLYADLMRFAANKALRSDNLEVKLSVKPAASLNSAIIKRQLDVNVFQTVTGLKLYNTVHPQQTLQLYGRTYITPMAIYSFNRSSIKQLQPHDSMLVPADPIAQAIALHLLEKAGVIQLKPNSHRLYTLNDVIVRSALPIQLQAAHISQLTGAGSHATNAILLYPNQALALGFNSHNMLFSDEQSLNQALVIAGPYHSQQQHNILLLLKAIRSQEIQQMISTLMHGASLSKAF